jgi:hypothetical protein
MCLSAEHGNNVLSQLGILLLYNSARLHSAAHTKETLQELKFGALDHPPYSPDLAHSDFISLDP